MNVTNKLKHQRRLSSRLYTVMSRGTPCTFKDKTGQKNAICIEVTILSNVLEKIKKITICHCFPFAFP